MWYLYHLRFRRVFGGEGGMKEARGIVESGDCGERVEK